MPFKVAIIGYGAIGCFLIEQLVHESRISIAGVLSRHAPTACPVPLTTSIEGLLSTRPDIVVECAGHQAIRDHGKTILRAGFDLLVASVGALADVELENGLNDAARAGNARLLIPGGALGGIDAISTAREAGLHSVQYISTKAPAAWKGTPAEDLVDLASVTAPKTFLECNARRAALQFPQNANVVAALALAGLGFDHTSVQLVVDPAAQRNCHSYLARGTFGEISATIQSVTLPSNPKTSVLAPYSLIYVVKKRAGLVLV